MDNPLIDHESSVTVYDQIANYLRNEINEGKIEKGARIPSETELADFFGASRGTVRKAISLLVEEGYLKKSHGKGTFVNVEKISYSIAQELISYAESMKKQNINFKTTVIEKEIVSADKEISEALNIDQGSQILFLKRLRTIEDEPAILLKNWVSIDRCPGIENFDYEEIGLFEAMETSIADKINYGIRNFSATNVDKVDAELLQLDDLREPILEIEQFTFNNADKPIECSIAYSRTDKYQVSSVLTRE